IEEFRYAVTRRQALQLLDEFIEERLADFGPYEDAMATDEPTLFHSTLSLYLNNGLLLPWEICERAIQAYKDGKAPINSVEGLVRQILGWREFIRIYYEAMMPEVREANFMNFEKRLPELFWSGDTDMHCLQQSLKAVIEQGYSHHIQRLMVLSNFSNLTKTDPRELNKWFWFAYV
ncbi:MAG: cryptochrome/photolyase family protein, partial [Aliifodinibius sp.]|nr:cryptochrome/photolyase family protein [Fodinibius sp.]NIV10574.1 cryptochrome/photolyase family protein [Fodinibius sp.]NIY24187.1 cryptochrome/photolyase family protein [Fodinibius sp.]